MLLSPFSAPGRFWRGNIHTHSTGSDGGRSVEDVIGYYRQAGYDFLTISDHFMERFDFPITDTTAYRGNSFTTILGAELHAPAISTGEKWHIVAAGLPADFAPTSETETGAELAQRAADVGAFIGLAHPAWYHLTLDDALTIECAHSVEVYNHGAALKTDRGNGFYLLDQMLAKGKRVTGYASDDAHFKGNDDGAGGWMMVRSETLDPDDLLTAMKAGQFYSSQGPQIHSVSIEGNEIVVECSPAISVIAVGYGSTSAKKIGLGITEARLSLPRFKDRYFRVIVSDQFHRKAWTNPVWLDDL